MVGWQPQGWEWTSPIPYMVFSETLPNLNKWSQLFAKPLRKSMSRCCKLRVAQSVTGHTAKSRRMGDRFCFFVVRCSEDSSDSRTSSVKACRQTKYGNAAEAQLRRRSLRRFPQDHGQRKWFRPGRAIATGLPTTRLTLKTRCMV